ncbi:hypothetical protein EJB05_12567 [Eragrostis curvula]|uniref:F-box domain-containing protein n=1 Tax=Eragrostis curvula TaxID=38414 RepID=A0A5J9VU40_9POAL|nr:hypothetical protein EJB05_12567 [Eragrostis curvula]
MQPRSGLTSPPSAPQGGAGSLSRLHHPGEDRISGLPEELLLHVLGALGSAREAARTSEISRRWRGLWTELRELTFTFRRVRADKLLEIALAQVRPGLRLHISQLETEDEDDDVIFAGGVEVSSLLRAVDRLAPAELVFRIDTCFNCSELPCFGRATSIDLYLPHARNVVLPPVGEFASLEQLKMVVYFVDLSALISRCPHLHKLQVKFTCSTRSSVSIESKSLEELAVDVLPAKDIVIVVPELKEFRFLSGYSGEFTISLSAPKLVDFLMQYNVELFGVGYDSNWSLQSLRMETRWSHMNKLLSLFLTILSAHGIGVTDDRTFAQEIARLPLNHFSVLELWIRTDGHVFAPLLLHLLLIRTSIERLELVLMDSKDQECSDYCDCDQDGSWRNEGISLPDLKDVEIQGFSAADHEVDFLELLFASAPMLKRINVKLSAQVSPSDGGCQKLRSIFQANMWNAMFMTDLVV